MTGPERAQFEQNVRHECQRCCGSTHFGSVGTGVVLHGQLTCARQDKEREVVKLRAPLDALNSDKGKKSDNADAIKAAEEKFALDVQDHGLRGYTGSPEPFGDRKCPALAAWDGLRSDSPPPADPTAQVDGFLASIKLTRLNG